MNKNITNESILNFIKDISIIPKKEKINFIINAIDDGWSVKKNYELENAYEFTLESLFNRSIKNKNVKRANSEPITRHDYIKSIFIA